MKKFVKAMIIKSMILMISVSFFFSCAKKQIKKEKELLTQNQTEQQMFKSTTTVTEISDDAFGDKEQIEADARKKAAASLKPVYFDFDKYDLKPESTKILSENAKIIMENNFSIIVEGHCDERGTEKYNLSLGQKRANVVKDYYIRLGVNPSKIATISYGEEMPVCFEKTEECWALNRRAETKITE